MKPDNEENLSEIIQQCKKGNRKAQAWIYHRFAPVMFGISLYYSKDRTEAEDILHDGFIKVFKNIHQFEGKGSFEGWIKRIIINTALERLRKQNILNPVEDFSEFTDIPDEELPEDDIPLEELIEMIQSLTPQYRAVFNLYVLEGMSHKEISKLLGISEGTLG